MEILPEIHRIESDLEERFMCQYLLIGEERAVLSTPGSPGRPRRSSSPTWRGWVSPWTTWMR